MPEHKRAELCADPVAMAALNECIEAWMTAVGPKASRGFLRAISSRVTSPVGPESALVARIWLQRQLPSWLSRFG